MSGNSSDDTRKVLRNVRPMGGPVSDFVIDGTRIAERLPAGTADAAWPTLLDGAGALVLPPLVEAHTHLDKTLWGQPWRPNSAGPTRADRIANEQRILRDFPVPVMHRAAALLEHCAALGSLHVRSHVDVQLEWGLRHVREMLALREAWRGRVSIELVAFPQGGLLARPGVAELMEEAMALGCDVVGGIDPAAIDRDPVRHLETVFGLARDHDRGVDIHLHDPGELGRWQIERICDFTESHARQGRVMISHAYCLGSFAPAEIASLADRLAALGISIMSCAPPHVSVPPLGLLRARGVNCCSGSDGIRDLWSPMGNGDMLERARLIAMRFGWSRDEDLAGALDIVTQGGARALGISGYGLEPGCAASFVLVSAETIGEAVVSHPVPRTVIAHGKLLVPPSSFGTAGSSGRALS